MTVNTVEMVTPIRNIVGYSSRRTGKAFPTHTPVLMEYQR